MDAFDSQNDASIFADHFSVGSSDGFFERFLPGRSRRIVVAVRKGAEALRLLSDRQLQDVCKSIRERAQSQRIQSREPRTKKDSNLIPVLSIALEAVRRQTGRIMHDVQLQAAFGLIQGSIVEMQTGEGKTLSALPAVLYHALSGEGVHVSTPNHYLAHRDHGELAGVYESLGITCRLLPDVDPAGDLIGKREAYLADVTYGPGYEFGFDYLRDQLAMHASEDLPLGQRRMMDFQGKSLAVETVMRRLACALVDEADNVLIDDACSPLVLSESPQVDAPDKEAILLAQRVCQDLRSEEDFRIQSRQAQLTEQGSVAAHKPSIPIPMEQLVRPWASYIENALQARYCYQDEIDYVRTEDRIKIVDKTTGRIFDDRTWNAGLHQAIEAKEGLSPTPDTIPLAQITRQRFFQLYRHLGGMTGTAQSCRTEFARVYRLGLCVLKPRLPSKRIELPLRTFVEPTAKWEAIAQSVREMHGSGRPVLVGTNTISDSLIVSDLLTSIRLPHAILNGCQNAEESEIISRAGQRGAITIATNMAGRGTDIALGEGVCELGGLHVIVAECHELARVDRQLVGRGARQGDPGSAQAFLSSQDPILAQHANWLSEAIYRMAKGKPEVDADLSFQIKKVQQAVERSQFDSRLRLLEQT